MKFHDETMMLEDESGSRKDHSQVLLPLFFSILHEMNSILVNFSPGFHIFQMSKPLIAYLKISYRSSGEIS